MRYCLFINVRGEDWFCHDQTVLLWRYQAVVSSIAVEGRSFESGNIPFSTTNDTFFLVDTTTIGAGGAG